MPVVTYQDLPLASQNRAWDGPAAKKRIKSWASSDGEIDFSKYRKAFLWYDAGDAETQGGYKMPIADVISGELRAVPKGVSTAANVLQGGQGGADIPDSDVSGCKNHLERYYAKMRKEFSDDSITAPWAKQTKELPRMNLRAEVSVADLEVREVAGQEDSVEFEGYAIRWSDEAEIGFFFRFKERFRKGAFAKTIAERGPSSAGGNGQIKFLRQHNDRQAVAAKLLELREDATGLFFKARTIATGVGRDLAVELREGVVDTLSVGFDAIVQEIDSEQDPILRTVIEARLFEISAVLWPAYAGATVEAIRDEQLRSFFDELEAALREGKVLSSSNFDRLTEARDLIDQVIESATPEPSQNSLEVDDETRDESDSDADSEAYARLALASLETYF